MKVGVDATALVKNRTGVGNYIYSILCELVKDHGNQFILYSNQEIFFPDSENVRKVVHTPYRKGPAWQNTQLLCSLFTDKPDVFWGGNGYLPIFTPVGTRLVLTVHDLVYKYAGKTMPLVSRWSRRFFQPLAVRKADAIVAVSQATSNEMTIEYGCQPDCIVHPQISTIFSLPNRKDVLNVKKKYELENYILTIGTLEPRKNMSALIQSYLNIIEAGHELPLLAIAGGKGWMQGELDRLVEVGVNKGVIKKLGYVPDADLSALYSGAHAFILASIYEGFGMPVLEAQASGCPVVISRIDSMLEAASDVCCCFEPKVDSISEALLKLSCNELPLVCRLPVTISNDAISASIKYLDLMVAN